MSGPAPVTADQVRATLWFWPLVAAGVSLLVTLGLATVRPDPQQSWATWAWPGDVQSASTLLQVVATSIMTATTLTFSLTVVALQLASQQFSPRLLREFARDRFTQSVLALLVSTFVVALTGLRGMDPDRPLPVLVVALTLVLGIVSAGALLVFVGHIVKVLRVDTMMVSVHGEAVGTVAETYPDYDDHHKDPPPGLPGPAGGELLPAGHSGFVRMVDPAVLVEGAHSLGVFLRVGVRPGDHVVAGTPFASVWSTTGDDVPLERVQRVVQDAIEVGYERTSEQDAALGLRQLTDIAVKAISPGINDPVTAGHAVGYCADLLVRLQGHNLGPQQHRGPDGSVRAVMPDRDHRYYLDLVCAPIRRFGRNEPLVLTALLRLLRDCAVAARDDGQRAEIARQAQLVLADVSPDLLEDDVDAVRDLARRVELALQGDVDAAYRDRAGETRSV